MALDTTQGTVTGIGLPGACADELDVLYQCFSFAFATNKFWH